MSLTPLIFWGQNEGFVYIYFDFPAHSKSALNPQFISSTYPPPIPCNYTPELVHNESSSPNPPTAQYDSILLYNKEVNLSFSELTEIDQLPSLTLKHNIHNNNKDMLKSSCTNNIQPTPSCQSPTSNHTPTTFRSPHEKFSFFPNPQNITLNDSCEIVTEGLYGQSHFYNREESKENDVHDNSKQYPISNLHNQAFSKLHPQPLNKKHLTHQQIDENSDTHNHDIAGPAIRIVNQSLRISNTNIMVSLESPRTLSIYTPKYSVDIPLLYDTSSYSYHINSEGTSLYLQLKKQSYNLLWQSLLDTHAPSKFKEFIKNDWNRLPSNEKKNNKELTYNQGESKSAHDTKKEISNEASYGDLLPQQTIFSPSNESNYSTPNSIDDNEVPSLLSHSLHVCSTFFVYSLTIAQRMFTLLKMWNTCSTSERQDIFQFLSQRHLLPEHRPEKHTQKQETSPTYLISDSKLDNGTCLNLTEVQSQRSQNEEQQFSIPLSSLNQTIKLPLANYYNSHNNTTLFQIKKEYSRLESNSTSLSESSQPVHIEFPTHNLMEKNEFNNTSLPENYNYLNMLQDYPSITNTPEIIPQHYSLQPSYQALHVASKNEDVTKFCTNLKNNCSNEISEAKLYSSNKSFIDHQFHIKDKPYIRTAFLESHSTDKHDYLHKASNQYNTNELTMNKMSHNKTTEVPRKITTMGGLIDSYSEMSSMDEQELSNKRRRDLFSKKIESLFTTIKGGAEALGDIKGGIYEEQNIKFVKQWVHEFKEMHLQRKLNVLLHLLHELQEQELETVVHTFS